MWADALSGHKGFASTSISLMYCFCRFREFPDKDTYHFNGTLSQLRVFEIAAARLGSFTLAAEGLCIAQPTVSVQIRKLTETVGVQLFINQGRGICLTDAGQCLYELCQAIRLLSLTRLYMKWRRMKRHIQATPRLVIGLW